MVGVAGGVDGGGHGAGGWLVAVGGNRGFAEGLVGSVMVVGRVPSIEGGLHLGEGVPGGSGVEDLEVQGEVEAFFFPVGLWVERPGVDHLDAQIAQPHRQRGPRRRR